VSSTGGQFAPWPWSRRLAACEEGHPIRPFPLSPRRASLAPHSAVSSVYDPQARSHCLPGLSSKVGRRVLESTPRPSSSATRRASTPRQTEARFSHSQGGQTGNEIGNKGTTPAGPRGGPHTKRTYLVRTSRVCEGDSKVLLGSPAANFRGWQGGLGGGRGGKPCVCGTVYGRAHSSRGSETIWGWDGRPWAPAIRPPPTPGGKPQRHLHTSRTVGNTLAWPSARPSWAAACHRWTHRSRSHCNSSTLSSPSPSSWPPSPLVF